MEDVKKPVPTNGTATADPAPNPFDPDRLRITQDFASNAGVKKVLTTIPCRKPPPKTFVRVRSGAEWRLQTCIYEDGESREIYLVAPQLLPELGNDVSMVWLFYAITRQGDPFLWFVKLPGLDGRSNPWNESALEAARLAESNWVRVTSNMSAGMYDTHMATGAIPEPVWPDLNLQKVLELAFKGRFVTTLDHPVLKTLRGEV